MNLKPLEELAKDWTQEANGLAEMGMPEQAETLRRCRDELRAAIKAAKREAG